MIVEHTNSGSNTLPATEPGRNDQLTEVYDSVRDFVDQRYRQFESEIDEQVVGPLRALTKDLAAEHESILDDLQSSASEKSLWQFQRDYRESVEHAIIERLQTHLEGEKPSTRLNSIYANLLTDLQAHAKRYPEFTELPFDKTIFSKRESDSTAVAARKRVARIRHGASRVFSSVKSVFGMEAGTEILRVPVRDLVEYHLQRRVPAAASEAFKAAHFDVGSYVGSLESGISSWFANVLIADRKLSRFDLSESEDGQTDDTKLFNEVVKAASGLQHLLESLVESNFSYRESDDSTLSYSWELFRLGLEGKGTFLSRLPVPVDQIGPPNIVGGADVVGEEWNSWHRQVIDRLTMVNGLIDVRDELLSIENDLVGQVKSSAVTTFSQAFGKLSSELLETRAQLSAHADAIVTEADLESFSGLLDQVQSRLLKTTEWLSSLPGFITAESFLDSAGEQAWERIGAFIDTLPDVLRIHTVDALRVVDPRSPVRTVHMRQSIRQATQSSLPTRLRDAASPVKQELIRAWASSEELSSMIVFNIDAARDEIRTFIDDPDGENRKTLQEVTTAAVELAVEGVQRAHDNVVSLTETVAGVADKFSARISDELLADWTVIHRTVRLGDDSTEKWDQAWMRFSQSFESLRFQVSEGYSKAVTNVRQWIRLGEREARGLIKKGQTAVGVLDQSEDKRAQSVSIIAGVSEFKESLPIVYRRLFGFGALTTPALLESRSRDLVWVRNFASRWKDSRGGGVAVIIGDPGSGRTSFLNVLDQTSLKDVNTAFISLTERATTEQQVVGLISKALNSDTEANSFQELTEQIRKLSDRVAILIDDVEHLFLQTSHGRDLFEQFMLFLSRNDRKICWILSIGRPAWKYLSSTSRNIVGFAATYTLGTVDRAGYEAIIGSRHRRSGVPLVFEEPTTTTSLIKASLKRSRTPEEVQVMLGTNYFESLRRYSGQNINLAILNWIRSVKFRDDGSLLVSPLQPVSFDFVNRYDTNLAFSLRSIMVHKTLSVSEHNQVFNFDSDDTTFALERLVNDRMICLAGADADSMIEQPEHYQDEMRFRIHPLVLHPVGTMLARSNLIH